ncbi:phosphoenolpyruvate synthase [Rubrolithibacter danxiaensis]|uniref:phosphoenolpyruvate synthase n=1 Tax=Rubrolithibacter danxiaensis TaxID=3390805 RepID=UPI003BF907D2
MIEYTIPFNKLDNSRVAQVGGKNASLGEMFRQLKSDDILIPDGFATTADAYWNFIEENNLKAPIHEALKNLDRKSFSNLSETGKKIRQMILDAPIPDAFSESIKKAYRELQKREQNLESVAVRSSATAEDLPEASFAGQHESFLNISGEDNVINAVHQCIASLFTDRAIKYREDNGFDHTKIALSAGVQKMVRSDLACAGVAFTIEPETGFDKVIFINGSWGLGDNVVGGVVNADQYYLYKENLRKGYKAILSKEPGSKEKTLVYAEQDSNEENKKNTINQDTPENKRQQFVLTDDEITQIGKWCLKIEEHYKKPMDIEWAKDGLSGDLYIVQARPETVHSTKKEKGKLKSYELKQESEIILTGAGIGNKVVAGKARILHSPQDADKLQEGEVLVTEITNPDWDPILKKASAIITNHGGRTSHAAIVAREMGAVAVVGTGNATQKISDGQEITVSSAEGNEGKVYKGILEWDETEIDLEKFGNPETEVMLIIADPKRAFQYALYPVDGVGLTRLEFAITNSIKIHPLALAKFNELQDQEVKEKIEQLTAVYPDKEQYFTERLSMAVATIAASFYPRPVIIRMSDFKSNEYASLLGGKQFEPEEQNPMLGFRGASRYYSEHYSEGFRLECEAMRIVIEEMKLDNVILMIPFCRTIEEGKKVVEVMESYGLKRGRNKLEVYMMIEIPSNVLGCEQFAEVFDGFSIGSNDLTQLTLGIDRDSELVSGIFNEQNAQAKEMIAMAIQKSKKAKRKIGLCGQAPSDFPEFAQFLVDKGIDSISFNPDALAKGIKNILKAEEKNKA